MERKYGTEIMKDEEVLLFVETAVENGSDAKEAIQDMKMIDTLKWVNHNQEPKTKYQFHLVIHLISIV